MRILLVEDDLPLAEALTTLLARAGYVVDVVHDGSAAEAAVAADSFDLVVLDLNLPGMDGLAVLRAIRSRRDGTHDGAAVMILTARGAPEDRVRGLDLGADDYLTKPFDVREFEARVRVLMRRAAGLRVAQVTVGRVVFDLTARQFTADGQILDLPPRERALLELMFLRAGKVVTREAIVAALTGFDDILSDNAIDQYVSRLRRRIAPLGANLRTARGLGYFLDRGAEGA
jgi:two-component system, OmpR family, response regulator